MVFQDPDASLNPRRRVGDIIAEPLRIRERGADAAARVAELLERVGLPVDHARRRPHQLSGGQRQRVAIARALILGPEVLVLDELVSALDSETRAHILDLLAELRRELGLSLLLIAHDLALVGGVADRVAVMRRGRIVETGPAAAIFGSPAHPYTRELLDAAPALGRGCFSDTGR